MRSLSQALEEFKLQIIHHKKNVFTVELKIMYNLSLLFQYIWPLFIFHQLCNSMVFL